MNFNDAAFIITTATLEKCRWVCGHGCSFLPLRKIPKFHLISWCINFLEKHSFRRVSRERQKLEANFTFPQNFHTRKLGETSVFYAMCFFTFSENAFILCEVDTYQHGLQCRFSLTFKVVLYYKKDQKYLG